MAGDSGPNNDCGRPECAKQPTIDKRQSAGAEVSAHTSLEPSADAKKHKRLRLFGAKTNEKQQSPGAQDVKPAMVSLLQLFRFSDALDRALMAIGAIAACVAGSGMPLMTVVISDLTDSFLAFNYGGNSGQTLDHTTRKYCLYFLALGLGMWVVASIQQLCWSIAAERTGRRVREAFYIAILRQDIGWFDDISTGELITRISGDVNLIQEGTGEKFSYVIQHVATFLTGAIIAFVKGWKLTLVVLSIVPMYAGTMSLLIVTIAKGTTSGQNAYAEAGSVADEVLSSIKTVMAFGGEGRELERYDEKIKKARAVGL
ncbi:Multidrug resistance protein 1, partial [Dipsacomyces acuminosporus]